MKISKLSKINGKVLCFIILIVFILLALFGEKIWFKIKNTVDPFTELSITSDCVLKGGTDIAEGSYDIEMIKGQGEYGVYVLGEGDKIHGYNVRNNENLPIAVNGEMKIIPSKEKALDLVNDEYKIQDAGNYYVGNSINSGKYQFSMIQENEEPITEAAVFIYDKDNDSSVLETISFNETKTATYELDSSMRISVSFGYYGHIHKSYLKLQKVE